MHACTGVLHVGPDGCILRRVVHLRYLGCSHGRILVHGRVRVVHRLVVAAAFDGQRPHDRGEQMQQRQEQQRHDHRNAGGDGSRLRLVPDIDTGRGLRVPLPGQAEGVVAVAGHAEQDRTRGQGLAVQAGTAELVVGPQCNEGQGGGGLCNIECHRRHPGQFRAHADFQGELTQRIERQGERQRCKHERHRCNSTEGHGLRVQSSACTCGR